MGRAFVGSDRLAGFTQTGQPFAQRLHFFPESRQFVAQLQHGFVLLHHMALEPGDPFFERLEVWFGHASFIAAA